MHVRKKSRSKKKRKLRAFKRKILREARSRGLTPTDIFAERMRAKPPKSDVWFQERWASLADEHDQYNVRFHGTIPDCINHKYKYVIEIDGSIHNRADVKKKDAKKDKFYASKGYEVFRVTAFDEDSIESLYTYVDRHKLKVLASNLVALNDSVQPKQRKYILRRKSA